MVIRELLELAVGRWPEELQDEMRAAWLAELHVLRNEGRRWEAWRFALSLALSRPPRSGAVVSLPVATTPRVTTAAVVLLTPLACLVLMTIAMIVAGLFFDATLTERPVERSLIVILSTAIAIWGWRQGRGSAVAAPLRVTLAVLAPIGFTALFINTGFPYGGHEPDVAIMRWLAAMVVTLWLAALLAGRGRRIAAWTVGVTGAVLTAHTVVILTVLDRVPGSGTIWPSPAGYGPGIDRSSAAAWFLIAFTERSLGLADPWETRMITDAVSMVPVLLVMFTPYALAYVISASHHRFLRLKTETRRSNSDPNGLSVTR